MLKTESDWMTRVGAAAVLSVAALGLSGCSDTTGTETGVDVQDVQEGAEDASAADTSQKEIHYGQAFYTDLKSLDGKTVTVSANVNEIISDNAFTIAGTDKTTVDALLVMHTKSIPDLKPGLTVAVTGMVHYVFDLPTVESQSGLTLDDNTYSRWDQKPYIEASRVDTTVDAHPAED